MRMMLKVMIPAEAGTRAIKDGSLPQVVGEFVQRWKPEATFFTAQSGQRTAFFLFDMPEVTAIPSIAEPFFAKLGCAIELCPAMNLEEMKTGVERAMKH